MKTVSESGGKKALEDIKNDMNKPSWAHPIIKDLR